MTPGELTTANASLCYARHRRLLLTISKTTVEAQLADVEAVIKDLEEQIATGSPGPLAVSSETMSFTEVCGVCEGPWPCPSGHNCGPLLREAPDEGNPVSKSRNTDPEVRGGEERGDWDPAVKGIPEEPGAVYDAGDRPEPESPHTYPVTDAYAYEEKQEEGE